MRSVGQSITGRGRGRRGPRYYDNASLSSKTPGNGLTKDTRGNARVGQMSSGRANVVGSGRGRDGHGNPERISFPTTASGHLPGLGLCSHRLPCRHTPSCSVSECFASRRKVYCRRFPSRRRPSCSHLILTIARNFSHFATQMLSHLICHPCVVYFFPSYDHGCNWIIPFLIIQLWIKQLHAAVVVVYYHICTGDCPFNLLVLL